MEFENYSWHDNTIHGFKIIESEYGTGSLELDIDYITEWLCSDNNAYEFKIAPATLVFESIINLQISLDYKTCTAGITPPSIHEIKRRQLNHPNGINSYSWEIEINWPSNGYIRFQAPSFHQTLRKEPIKYNQQVLPDTKRN